MGHEDPTTWHMYCQMSHCFERQILSQTLLNASFMMCWPFYFSLKKTLAWLKLMTLGVDTEVFCYLLSMTD